MTSAPFPQRLVTLGRQIQYDAQLGHRFIAGVQRRVPHECGAYFVHTNRQGFREDHDLESPPAGFHVLCYGDSFTAGDGVDNSRRFSALLAELLGITVSNVAVPGHGPDQNVLQLERSGLPQADLILWCIAVHTIDRIQTDKRFTIDHEGRLWRVDRPHFALTTDGELELHGVPVPEVGDELTEDPFPQIRSSIAAACAPIAATLRSRLVTVLGPYLKPAPDPDYRDEASPGWSLLSALARRFHRSAGGVPVVIVPLPTVRYLAEDNERHFQRRFAELEQPAAGLHVLDITTAMRRAPRAERRGFCYRSDGHYTKAGHRAVAAALAEQMERRDLLPRRAAAAVTPIDARAERKATSIAGHESRADLTLELAWSADEGFASLFRQDDRVVAEQRDTAITRSAYRPGVLPLSAVHACLDDAHIAGPELRTVRLRSPCTPEDLVDIDRADPLWFALTAGWIRWHGAAETDLRDFLQYGGPVERVASKPEPKEPACKSRDAPEDDESTWLRQRLARLDANMDAATLERRLRKLARHWERATRAARAMALPSAAPLRRGRIAVQIAKSSSTGAA